MILGSPETCLRRLEASFDRSPVPVHHLVVQLQLAGIEPQKAWRTMDQFAEHILLRLRER
ncbi:MAG TPA: hypothetical protein VHL09_16385 [Dehalococcoidia bacterium]|nr:hypothetical protein [Dehalococcoidia bacterium]